MARGPGGKQKYLYLLDDPELNDSYKNVANKEGDYAAIQGEGTLSRLAE
jgi:hypothetical protein